ncbi:MAG: EAL domain-containing response regulator [Pseudomonas sp.]|nr:EAL domain-containing response regulator [Pseudomonas sp.]
MSVSALSVLVVEDHGFQRRMALRLLSELGVTDVHEAGDGLAALQLLETLPHPPDVVMVDLDMPGMDGIQFIGQVAERAFARGVLVVSALDPALLHTVQTIARSSGLRVLGSVEKPLTRDKLLAALQRADEGDALAEDVVHVEPPANQVHAALIGGEIGPWFQPQVEFGNGRVVGVEALARWRQPDGSVVRPAQFLPVVEREGLLDVMTDHMLLHACQWRRQWERQGMRLKVSVNVSPSTLVDPGAADRFQHIVQSQGLEPQDVVLEVTESSVVTDPAQSLGVLARLRLKGFGLSIDDFGTGYSSLAQLSQVPFTELKIDQGFVSGAHAQPRKRAVIEASLELARKMNLDVVAEGVETIEDWQMLAELGCGAAQGFLIAQAVPGGDLAATVAQWRRPGH